MCGLAGILYSHRDHKVEPAHLQLMANQIRHRGPDSEGIYTDGQLGLAHRRLSIIDVASGQQPMTTPDQGFALVFNGEIYNHLELQSELHTLGHSFRTHSDTEVLLHSYMEWGEECTTRLRGMYAFAVWDQKQRTLFCARDRVGIKPFYYCFFSEGLAFASELKSLLVLPGVDKSIHTEALQAYLLTGYIPGDDCAFKAIKKLPAGHSLTFSPQQKGKASLKIKEFWDILKVSPQNNPAPHKGKQEIIEQVRQSVSSHLMSEVPLGAFLSGGVDSTSVVACMRQLGVEDLKTITIGFSDKAFDEAQTARESAQFYKTTHFEHQLEMDLPATLHSVVQAFDEPLADSSALPTFHLCRLARENVTVVLSGDGGDELFAGYNWYTTLTQMARSRRAVPEILQRPLKALVETIPRGWRGRENLLGFFSSPFWAYIYSRCLFTPSEIDSFFPRFKDVATQVNSLIVKMEHTFQKVQTLSPLRQLQYMDMKYYMVDDILTKVDRMSMQHSLEVRVPLLDNPMIDLAWSMPDDFKLREGQKKFLFKTALEPMLPPGLLHKPKMGFTPPLSQWFSGGLSEVLQDTLRNPRAFICDLMDKTYLQSLLNDLQKPVSYKRGTADRLFALLMLELWHKQWCQN